MEMRSQNNTQLEQFKEQIACSAHLEIGEHEDNDDWQWIDVKIDDHDPMGRSGIAANYAKQNDFKLCEVDFENQTIRFNRKK